ncbi:MAG: sle [Chloroflexi bacterium]|nr:sle [Chloroflexota bacterium]
MAAQHILVVDDDPNIRQAIQWALEDDGLKVETAADGRQAVERVAAHRPSLMVLDMALPLLDGRQVVQELRANYGDAPPIVVITADGRAGEKAKQVGALAYLRKPFEVESLVAAVRSGLSQV